MGDLVFMALIVAFFALAVAFVRACELVLGRPSVLDDRSEP
jgi:hypothetical protein